LYYRPFNCGLLSSTVLNRFGFEQQQDITVIARDRERGHGEAAATALPHATQVADRWYLMENAGRAFLDAIRTAVGAATINNQADRPSHGPQPETRPSGRSGKAARRLPRAAKLAGHASALARCPMVVRVPGADLWRRVQEQGFRGSLRVVSGWATGRRRCGKGRCRKPTAHPVGRHDRTINDDRQSRALDSSGLRGQVNALFWLTANRIPPAAEWE
jgi:hypothetical protein